MRAVALHLETTKQGARGLDVNPVTSGGGGGGDSLKLWKVYQLNGPLIISELRLRVAY